MSPLEEHLGTENTLVRTCLDLEAAGVGGPLSAEERAALRSAQKSRPSSKKTLAALRRQIRDGEDPLGDMFCKLRSGEVRRRQGAFYTPLSMIEPMVAWILDRGVDRVVDPGCGSGRFCIATLEKRPELNIVAIDLDPIATLMTRANLAARNAGSARVLHADYTMLRLPRIAQRTGFVGNPPYVRHHNLTTDTKLHGAKMAHAFGHRFSQLSGLHVHFFLSTATNAQVGDVGAFVTSAEWLDVAYGSIVRELMLNGLGGRGIHLIQPKATTFEDAMTTAAIAYFEVGSDPRRLRMSLAKTPRFTRLGAAGKSVAREMLASSTRWSPIVTAAARAHSTVRFPPTHRLGDLVKVSRGQVTGANDFFVMSKRRARELGIEDVCVPAITAAEEIFMSEGRIFDGEQRKVVLDPPRTLRRNEHFALDRFLKLGEASLHSKQVKAVAKRYICAHREPWWCVRAPKPAIVMTYMARQAPKFALNMDGLALLNVGHALYPRVPLTEADLEQLVSALNGCRESFRGHGRTYQGGLEKFEPREVEDLPLPPELYRLLAPILIPSQ
jgi:adenine-specific DNA-methyltransferase